MALLRTALGNFPKPKGNFNSTLSITGRVTDLRRDEEAPVSCLILIASTTYQLRGNGDIHVRSELESYPVEPNSTLNRILEVPRLHKV